jgi:hypothetical protein
MARTRPSVRVVVDADAFVSAVVKESLWLALAGFAVPGSCVPRNG